MNQLELLAPARDIQVGIAAIDCGADAVYIAGPRFGARHAAGNEVDQIRELCSYAHRFGARIFVTLNTILYDDELEDAFRMMMEVKDAGADAIIIQDLAAIGLVRRNPGKIHIPLHASTQCAIRTPEQAVFLESLGFSRLILERELSLEEIRRIRESVSCELEFFVHGALCVCYSGQCYLSEKIAGRSANRGTCIQACRSRYDLIDDQGRTLVKDKALLSLKDYNLKDRLEDLAEAGITSFKIEGRLKNISYVRNVVRDYSIALEDLICRRSGKYERGSYGKVSGGFVPDTEKTFNRGYTELYLDGTKGKWAAMDAAKSMGEEIGTVSSLNKDKSVVSLRISDKATILNNGDGFSFVAADGSVCGFRGDVCSGNTIRCKSTPELYTGARIFRNIDVAFEKGMDRKPCQREIRTDVWLNFSGPDGHARAVTEDGRTVCLDFDCGSVSADNQDRMKAMIVNQIEKSSGHYRLFIKEITAEGPLPFMSASALNGIRRELADRLEEIPCQTKDILNRTDEIKPGTGLFPFKDATYRANISNHLAENVYKEAGAVSIEKAYEIEHQASAELMRTRYCIRHELGLCPKQSHGKDASSVKASPLYLLNNGQRFTLVFDCRRCEMLVNTPQPQK